MWYASYSSHGDVFWRIEKVLQVESTWQKSNTVHKIWHSQSNKMTMCIFLQSFHVHYQGLTAQDNQIQNISKDAKATDHWKYIMVQYIVHIVINCKIIGDGCSVTIVTIYCLCIIASCHILQQSVIWLIQSCANHDAWLYDRQTTQCVLTANFLKIHFYGVGGSLTVIVA